MIISVLPDEPGGALYALLQAAKREAAVYLDGLRQSDIVRADERSGYVTRVVRGPSNERVLTDIGALVTETLRGRVRIEIERA